MIRCDPYFNCHVQKNTHDRYVQDWMKMINMRGPTWLVPVVRSLSIQRVRPTDHDKKRESCFPPQRKERHLILNFIPTITRVVKYNSVVECLPSIYKALGSIPSTIHIYSDARMSEY